MNCNSESTSVGAEDDETGDFFIPVVGLLVLSPFAIKPPPKNNRPHSSTATENPLASLRSLLSI